MNKTVVFITYSTLAALGLIGAVIVILVSPNQFGSFTGYLVVLLGLVTTAAATFWSLGKAKEELANVKEETSTKLDVVQKQTNGTLTKLISMNAEKDTIIKHKDRRIADLEAALLKQIDEEENVT